MSSGQEFVLDQRGGNVALDLFVVQQHLGSFLSRALEGTGVTPSEYVVYGQLDQRPATPRELSRTLGLRPTTLSGYLATLERAGHLRREQSTRDRRSSTLFLTESGAAKAAECRQRMRTAVRLLDGLLGGAAGAAVIRATLGGLDSAIVAAEEKLASRS